MENHKDGPGPAGLVRTDVPMTAVPDKVVRRLPGTLARDFVIDVTLSHTD